MGLADYVVNDSLVQWWGGTEATFGAGPAADPAAGDAFDHEGADLGEFFQQRVIQIGDKTGVRSRKAPVQGPFDPVALKLSILARAGATAGTLPSFGFLFLAGGFSNVGGVLSRALAPDKSAWLWGASADGMVGHGFAGAVVEGFTLSGGEDLARLEANLQAARGSYVCRTTLKAAGVAAATTIQIADGHGWQIAGAPAWIKVAGGVATIHKITAFNATTGTATITPAVPAGGYTMGAEVSPAFFARTPVTQNAIAEQDHTLDLNAGADQVIVTKFGVTVQTGMALRPKEAGVLYRSGVVATRPQDGARITADVVYTLDKQKIHGYLRDLSKRSLVITLGPAAGRRIKLAATDARVEKFPSIEGAEAPRVGTFELGCYNETTGDDLSISFL